VLNVKLGKSVYTRQPGGEATITGILDERIIFVRDLPEIEVGLPATPVRTHDDQVNIVLIGIVQDRVGGFPLITSVLTLIPSLEYLSATLAR